jgi:hypothetical protein
MILVDLLLWGAGLALANQAWDAFQETTSWIARGRSAWEKGLLFALPAALCWGALLHRSTSRLEQRSIPAPPPLAQLADRS